MAIYIEGNKKIKKIFANVNGEKKSISSVWVNKDGVPTKVFQLDRGTVDPVDPYEIAPEGELNKWNHNLDTENKIVTLEYYDGSPIESDVVIYANYIVNGEIYKTRLKGYANNYRPSRYLFEKNSYITSVKFSDNLDITNLVNTSSMFSYCDKLVSVDFGQCFTINNITVMDNMFYYCNALQHVNLSKFNTEKVTSMFQIFYYCSTLQILDLSYFNTGNVTRMGKMFYGASALKNIYVLQDKWIINSSCNTTDMFKYCGTSSVTYI